MRLRVGLAGRNTRAAPVAGLLSVARRGRKAVAAGLARNAADVFGLRYRIITPGFEAGDFRLWAELPAGMHGEALTPPLPPLGWDMQLRSYLTLVFERTSERVVVSCRLLPAARYPTVFS